MPHFYHYYQLRVQSIWDWQPASILHFMPQPHKDYSSAGWCPQSIQDTLCFAEGPSSASNVLNTASHMSLAQMEHDRAQVTISSLRGSAIWVQKESLAMMPLLTVAWHSPHPTPQAEPLSLRYAEQIIIPNIRGVWFPRQGLQDYPYTCALWGWGGRENERERKREWE